METARVAYEYDTWSLMNTAQDSAEVYEILHMEQVVATISENGTAKILTEQFMPYDLYFETETDYDTRFNNKAVFYHWCATRVLTLDRAYAKAILNSIGASQSTTDKDRAQIALTYHCVSLTDVYWVRRKNENITFDEINLYNHSLNRALIDIPLCGRQMTVTNRELAQDLSTKGCFPKAWIRDADGFFLLKDGGCDTVRRELLASKIAQCFAFRQVTYDKDVYDGQIVTKSKIVTSLEYSIVSRYAFGIYATNHDLNVIDECVKLDKLNYYGMNIVDYLIGNTDRHQENWGFTVDNSTNRLISLHPLMDFNQSFNEYDTLDGGNCLTVESKMSQREAAISAVRAIGLNQLREPDMSLFDGFPDEADMFRRRLDELKKNI